MFETKQLVLKGKKIGPRKHRKVGSNSHKANPNPSCNDKRTKEAKIDINRSISDDQIALEQLIGKIIRNALADPNNVGIPSNLMALSSELKNPIQINTHQRGKHFASEFRDISKYEIIRPRDLPQVTGLSRTTIWRLEKEGLFVNKIKLSAGAVGFRRIDVERWLEERQTVEN